MAAPVRTRVLLALAAVLAVLWAAAFVAVDAPTCDRERSVDWLPCVAPDGVEVRSEAVPAAG